MERSIVNVVGKHVLSVCVVLLQLFYMLYVSTASSFDRILLC